MSVKATPQMKELLRRSGSANPAESAAGMAELTVALREPLRDGVMSGDITFGIFETEVLERGAVPEYPLSFLAPGTEKDYVAYTVPNHGYIPERHVEGDTVMVPTYDIANATDWLIKYARDARWNIVAKALRVYEAGFVKKINDDAWHTITAAGVDRNIVVYDSAAAAGQFTKRLVSLGKTVMRRNGGGNSTSMNRGKLTHLYVSPEGMEDIRDWGVDQVDEVTRREIFVAEDGEINRIFGVNLVSLDELGEDQEYQLFYSNDLGGALASGDVELAVGLDLLNNDSFVMPIREELQTHEDPTLVRSRKNGVFGWMELGVAALDGRRVLLFSF